MDLNMRLIGARCKAYRMSLGYYQADVAKFLDYSKENISAFENGRNDNLRILLWYILHGMTTDQILGREKNGKSI